MPVDDDIQTTPDQAVAEQAVCPVCPHPLDGHDRVSARYCAATAVIADDRGCLCPTLDNDATSGSSHGKKPRLRVPV
ncbi:MAG: RGCVC family protein [Actinomycetota bacterium]|nr:RGCVC family protein [Actinomycetota bacterium]